MNTLRLLRARLFGTRPRTFVTLLVLIVLAAVAEYARQIPLVSYETLLLEGTKKPGEVTLLVTGDTGMDSEGQRMVATLLESLCEQKDPDGVLLLGDNFYYDGVEGTDDPQWRSKFHAYYDTPCLARLKFYAILGNHDYNGDPSAQIRYTRVSQGRWVMPARAYTVAFGDVLTLTALDSNFPDRCYFRFLCSLDRLEYALAASRSTWRVAAGHHPALSGGKYPRLKPYPRHTLPPFLCRNGFDAYFSGHDHNMQHIEGTGPDIPCRLRQVVLGNGGAPLTEVREIPGTVYAKSAYGAGVAKFTHAGATVEFHQAPENGVVHAFSLPAPGTAP
jgi:tartrate-resistant acid phosphatase type 5